MISYTVNAFKLNMNSKNILSAIAQQADTDVKTVGNFVELLAKIITEECGRENKIAIPGFGTFEGCKHDEKIVTDLTTGKNMLLPPSIDMKFIAGGMLKKKVKGGAK